MKFFRGEYVPSHPVFPAGSKASCGVETAPVDINAPDIEYTHEDDKAVDAYNARCRRAQWSRQGRLRGRLKKRHKMHMVQQLVPMLGTFKDKAACEQRDYVCHVEASVTRRELS